GNVVEQSFYGLLVFGIHHGTIADNVVTGASTGLTVRPSFAEPPERSGDLLIDGNDLSGNGWIREAGTFGEIKIAPGALDGPVTVARNRIAARRSTPTPTASTTGTPATPSRPSTTGGAATKARAALGATPSPEPSTCRPGSYSDWRQAMHR